MPDADNDPRDEVDVVLRYHCHLPSGDAHSSASFEVRDGAGELLELDDRRVRLALERMGRHVQSLLDNHIPLAR